MKNHRKCLIRTSRSVPFQTLPSQEAICSRKHLQFNACERVELKFPRNTPLTTRKFRRTWKEDRPLKGSGRELRNSTIANPTKEVCCIFNRLDSHYKSPSKRSLGLGIY
ncbi:hypothetical protein CDAR_463161 [Caerostris darwini]|uniref:Uncharacterized protein n=1 Tax=Caerostris darwini TaxID=1538125 RepID=A0AAV4Q8S6_9ARAC|nr:hypothetical protein CDAR_463161 [Caerostris darwini]